MDTKTYELSKDKLKAQIDLSVTALEKYLTVLEAYGNDISFDSAKERHYLSTSDLIATAEKAEQAALEISKQIIAADAKDLTVTAVNLEKLLNAYITMRKSIEEYLSHTDSILINSAEVFPSAQVKQSTESTLRKIKMLLNQI